MERDCSRVAMDSPRHVPRMGSMAGGRDRAVRPQSPGHLALHPNDLPSHPTCAMSRRFSRSLRLTSRLWVAVVCTTVAITASGVPCLCVCLGHAAEPQEHRCHHSASNHGDVGHAGSHSECPPASTCMQDQTPAVSTQPASLALSLEQSSLFSGAIDTLDTVPLEPSVLLRARASPDRSPPIPPSKFTVLRL